MCKSLRNKRLEAAHQNGVKNLVVICGEIQFYIYDDVTKKVDTVILLKKNVKLVKSVVDFCHAHDCSVEAELGRLGGVEDDMSVDAESAFLTDPMEAKRFVERTGVDSLAVAIGTAHGLYTKTPKIDFQRLAEIREVVDIPLVLHGASDVPDDFVRRTIELGVCKVNVATELKIAFAAAVKEWFAENPEGNDPRYYMRVGMNAMKEVVRSKINVCGSANRLLPNQK